MGVPRRPPKRYAAAREALEVAVGRSLLDDDYPVTIWTGTDLIVLSACRCWAASTATVYRNLETMDYLYRHPLHDRTHR